MVNMSRMKLKMLEHALVLSVLIAAASAALAQAFGLLLADAGFVAAAVPRHAAPARCRTSRIQAGATCSPAAAESLRWR